MYSVYIHYSKDLSRYYIGETSMLPTERLKKHLSNHSGYTSKAKDWLIVFTCQVSSKSEAQSLEKQIKKRGAKRWMLDKRHEFSMD